MKRKKEPCSCYSCKAKIRFIKPKNAEKAVVVDTPGTYFVPVPPGANGERFITKDGYEHEGHVASDGLYGFRPHQCRSKLHQ